MISIEFREVGDETFQKENGFWPFGNARYAFVLHVLDYTVVAPFNREHYSNVACALRTLANRLSKKEG